MEGKSLKLKLNLKPLPKMGKVKSKKCEEEIEKATARLKELGVDPSQIPLPDDDDNDCELETGQTGQENSWFTLKNMNFVESAQKLLHDFSNLSSKIKEDSKDSSPPEILQKATVKLDLEKLNNVDDNSKFSLKPITMTKSHTTNSWYISDNGDGKKIMKKSHGVVIDDIDFRIKIFSNKENITHHVKQPTEAEWCILGNSTTKERILPNPFDHSPWKVNSDKIHAWQVSAILVENNKPWQYTVSWNLRNHLILKVMELFLRVFSAQATEVSKSATLHFFLPFSKNTEVKIYQMANSKMEYYEMLCQEILDFQDRAIMTRQILQNKLPPSLVKSNITPLWLKKLERYMDERLAELETKRNANHRRCPEVKSTAKKIPANPKTPLFKAAMGQLTAKGEKREKLGEYKSFFSPYPTREEITCSRCKTINPDMHFCLSCEGFSLCDECEKIDDHPHYMTKKYSQFKYLPTSTDNDLETAVD